MINKFENLEAWKQSKDLAVLIYKITNQYPKNEIYGLTSQTNRAVVSISANVAEGCSRKTEKDFCHFLDMALGSAFELKTLLIIAFENQYLCDENNNILESKLTDCIKLIYGLKRSLND